MLVWYLDDGHIRKEGKNQFSLELATNSFTSEDIDFLVSILNKRYGKWFYKSKHVKRKDGSQSWTINCSTAGTIAFIKDIKDIFPNCMQRKNKWQDIDLDASYNRSILMNPAVDKKILYNTLLTFSHKQKISARIITDLMIDKMPDERAKKWAIQTIYYHLNKLCKNGFLKIENYKCHRENIFYLTPLGKKFFQQQINSLNKGTQNE